jgi:hypothetical protein
MTTFLNGVLFTFKWPDSELSIRDLWNKGSKRAAYWKLCPCKHPQCIMAYDCAVNPQGMPLLNSDASPISKENLHKIIASMLI